MSVADYYRASSRRLLGHWFAIGMTFFVTLGMLFLPTVQEGGNDASRWSTVWSLTHGQGYIIDNSPYSTVDKVYRDGHFYSSKPPLLPSLLAGLACLIRALTGYDLPDNEGTVIKTILILINLVPFYIATVLYANLLERRGFQELTRCLCLLVFSLGTYLTAYSTSLNNHTIGAMGCFFAVYNLIRIVYEGKRDRKYFVAAGFFSAWTFCNELPAALLPVGIFWWLIRVDRKETLRFFLPPAVLLAALFLLTTCLATGGVIPNYLRSDLYHYPNSYWNNPQGIDAADESKLIYLGHFLLGHHGIFSLTPVLVFAAIGLFTDRQFRLLHRMTLILTTVLMIFLVVKTNNYGGICQGPRWTFWLIPMWLMALPAAIDSVKGVPYMIALLVVTVLISLGSVIYAISGERGPWGVSWLHLLMRTQGIVDY